MKFTNADIENYLSTVSSSKNLSSKTIAAYRSDLFDFYHFFSECGLVDSTLLLKYVTHLQLERKLKDSSISRKLITLKAFFSYLKKTGCCDTDYFAVCAFHFRREKRLPKTISHAESKKLLTTAALQKEKKTGNSHWISIRNLALIDILISTGIRIAEASAIALGDIIATERLILIHGKGKRQRIIYISCPQTWTNLTEWIKVRKGLTTKTDKLFINKYGNQITIHGIEYIYNSLKKAAGISSKSTPHYLRHTFATNLLSNGADLRSVQELLGHASVSTTEIYTEVSAKRKKQVLNKYNYRNKL